MRRKVPRRAHVRRTRRGKVAVKKHSVRVKKRRHPVTGTLTSNDVRLEELFLRNNPKVRIKKSWPAPGQLQERAKMMGDAAVEDFEWADAVMKHGAGTIPPETRSEAEDIAVERASRILEEWPDKKNKPHVRDAIIRNVQRERF